MDPTMEPTVYIAPTPWYKRKLVWAFVLLLILIPLGSFIYKNFIMTKEPQPVADVSGNVLTDKARSLGYEIIWINPNDATGRTAFYRERPKGETDFRGAGIIYTESTSSASRRLISYIAGSFIDFKEIEGSSDLYLNFINPQTGIYLPKVRLILSKDSSIETFFRVEDLSKNATEGSLGILSDWTLEKLNKIIATGDAVVVRVTSKDRDLIATILVIRRFGGKTQIEKELHNSGIIK